MTLQFIQNPLDFIDRRFGTSPSTSSSSSSTCTIPISTVFIFCVLAFVYGRLKWSVSWPVISFAVVCWWRHKRLAAEAAANRQRWRLVGVEDNDKDDSKRCNRRVINDYSKSVHSNSNPRSSSENYLNSDASNLTNNIKNLPSNNNSSILIDSADNLSSSSSSNGNPSIPIDNNFLVDIFAKDNPFLWRYLAEEEGASWLNSILDQLWPFFSWRLEEFIDKKVKEEVQKALAGYCMDKIVLTGLNLYDHVPKIISVKVKHRDGGSGCGCCPTGDGGGCADGGRGGGDKSGHDSSGRSGCTSNSLPPCHVTSSYPSSIALDVDFLYSGENAEAFVDLGIISVRVKDLSCRGLLRFDFRPLIPTPPFFDAVDVAFIESPTIDFDFNVDKVVDWLKPAVKPKVIRVVDKTVDNLMVMPNSKTFETRRGKTQKSESKAKEVFNEDSKISISPVLGLSHRYPQGVVRVTLTKAKDLKSDDDGGRASGFSFLNVFSKPDVFVAFKVGAQRQRSTTVNNDLTPSWEGKRKRRKRIRSDSKSEDAEVVEGETFEFLVDDLEEQQLEIRVYDEDVDDDDLIGEAEVELKDVWTEGVLECWFEIRKCREVKRRKKAQDSVEEEEENEFQVYLKVEWLGTVDKIPDIMADKMADQMADKLADKEVDDQVDALTSPECGVILLLFHAPDVIDDELLSAVVSLKRDDDDDDDDGDGKEIASKRLIRFDCRGIAGWRSFARSDFDKTSIDILFVQKGRKKPKKHTFRLSALLPDEGLGIKNDNDNKGIAGSCHFDELLKIARFNDLKAPIEGRISVFNILVNIKIAFRRVEDAGRHSQLRNASTGFVPN